jgi:phosphopantothenoylcysteine decarboxylase/phosphopantothenate--cysteine ligase
MAQEIVTLLRGKRIVLAVTGSIAVYKAVDLASKLTQAGALVEVVMSEAAERFVTPLTFQSVTGRPVYDRLWQSSAGGGLPTHIAHVGLGESADLIVVAPATANTLAKLAAGAADDLLTVTTLAARCPLLIAPAMDGGMYQHPATQANLRTLTERGVLLIEPDEGRFASGLVGRGRLPETPALLGHIRLALARAGSLAGRHMVVTAGGTREPLDPVRFITNESSGKQGYALAQAGLDAGAQVTLISAARDLPPPTGACLIEVDSARSMLAAVLEAAGRADALLMAAAVADFRPASLAEQKIKKSDNPDEGLTIELARNPDILLAVKEQRATSGRPLVVVGFAAESEDLLANAAAKVAKKGLDLIVANDISASDAGFRVDTNRVVLLDAAGDQQAVDLASKTAVAEIVISRVVTLLNRGDLPV